jgi:hypothetical protein
VAGTDHGYRHHGAGSVVASVASVVVVVSKKPSSSTPEILKTAPDAPDARVLALDIGLYGHRGGISSMFWYRTGGKLHAHMSQLLPEGATLLDQLDMLEQVAEVYPEYRRVSPAVVIGVTVLSPVGRRQVRTHLDRWINPPHRRRLIAVGDYAREEQGIRSPMSRKKLRDLISDRLTQRTITLTRAQHDAVAEYTGRRQKPGRDSDDEWRTDETDALALPVAYTCVAAAYMLPPPQPTVRDRLALLERSKRAWQMQQGLSEGDAWDRAIRLGHPDVAQPAETSSGGGATQSRSTRTRRALPLPSRRERR